MISDLEADDAGYVTDRVWKISVGEDDGAIRGTDWVRLKAKADTSSSQAKRAKHTEPVTSGLQGKQTKPAKSSRSCCIL